MQNLGDEIRAEWEQPQLARHRAATAAAPVASNSASRAAAPLKAFNTVLGSGHRLIIKAHSRDAAIKIAQNLGSGFHTGRPRGFRRGA